MGETKFAISKRLFSKGNMKDFMFIVFGILSYAVGYTAFILPERVVMGGVSGLSALIYYATNIPAGISIFVLNITLLIIAFSALTKQFVVRTIIGVLPGLSDHHGRRRQVHARSYRRYVGWCRSWHSVLSQRFDGRNGHYNRVAHQALQLEFRSCNAVY